MLKPGLLNRYLVCDKDHISVLFVCSFQAVQYLKLLARFKEIGFSENAIQPALLSTDLDENKTLDLLTTTS